jgi:hypothetical protein
MSCVLTEGNEANEGLGVPLFPSLPSVTKREAGLTCCLHAARPTAEISNQPLPTTAASHRTCACFLVAERRIRCWHFGLSAAVSELIVMRLRSLALVGGSMVLLLILAAVTVSFVRVRSMGVSIGVHSYQRRQRRPPVRLRKSPHAIEARWSAKEGSRLPVGRVRKQSAGGFRHPH